jgi:uncharacterized membrane protein
MVPCVSLLLAEVFMITISFRSIPRGRSFRRASLAIALFAGVASARPAHAQLDICNTVGSQLHVAVAYQTDGSWSSQSWHVDPGDCVTVVSRSLGGVSYYVSAHRDAGDGFEWAGDRLFCTADGSFELVAVQYCSQQGYRTRQFIQLNVGMLTRYSFFLQYPTYGRQAVADVRVGDRASYLGDGTRVLILQNANPHPVSLALQCYKPGGYTKLLPVSIPRYGYAEVGFMQGWDNNFAPGDRCEAYFEGNPIWTYRVQ